MRLTLSLILAFSAVSSFSLATQAKDKVDESKTAKSNSSVKGLKPEMVRAVFDGGRSSHLIRKEFASYDPYLSVPASVLPVYKQVKVIQAANEKFGTFSDHLHRPFFDLEEIHSVIVVLEQDFEESELKKVMPNYMQWDFGTFQHNGNGMRYEQLLIRAKLVDLMLLATSSFVRYIDAPSYSYEYADAKGRPVFVHPENPNCGALLSK